MRINLLLFIPVIIYIFSSCGATHKSKDNSSSASPGSLNDSLLIKERLKLKKYAFCRCLINKYPLDSFLLKDGSLEGFLQTSSYGNHAYGAIDSFVQKKSSVNYSSKNKKNLYLMRCMDIYEDQELELLIGKLDHETSILK
jgi:hypothetical protein